MNLCRSAARSSSRICERLGGHTRSRASGAIPEFHAVTMRELSGRAKQTGSRGLEVQNHLEPPVRFIPNLDGNATQLAPRTY
jgi:hypothetical protein